MFLSCLFSILGPIIIMFFYDYNDCLRKSFHLNNSDQQWDSEDDAEDEWGDDLAHSHLHEAPLSQRDLQVPPNQLQHRQTHLRPVPHATGWWPGMTSAGHMSHFPILILFFKIFFWLFSVSFPRWSLWGRLVKVEEGCMLSVSFSNLEAPHQEPTHCFVPFNSWNARHGCFS